MEPPQVSMVEIAGDKVEISQSDRPADDWVRMPESFVVVMISDQVSKLRNIQLKLLTGGSAFELECQNGHPVAHKCSNKCKGGILKLSCSVHDRSTDIRCNEGCPPVSANGSKLNTALKELRQYRVLRNTCLAAALQDCWDLKTVNVPKNILLKGSPELKKDFVDFEKSVKALSELAEVNETVALQHTKPKEGYQIIPRIVVRGKTVVHKGTELKVQQVSEARTQLVNETID